MGLKVNSWRFHQSVGLVNFWQFIESWSQHSHATNSRHVILSFSLGRQMNDCITRTNTQRSVDLYSGRYVWIRQTNRKLKVKDEVMLSFDVESLFPNVPLIETVNLTCDYITGRNMDVGIPVQKLKEFIRRCTFNVHFLFDGIYYRQIATWDPIRKAQSCHCYSLRTCESKCAGPRASDCVLQTWWEAFCEWLPQQKSLSRSIQIYMRAYSMVSSKFQIQINRFHSAATEATLQYFVQIFRRRKNTR